MTHHGKPKLPPPLNKYMHPKNTYKIPPSFKLLATEYPEFRKHCTYDLAGKVHLDFKNADAIRTLTTVMLHKDFDLKVNIPEHRLVPTLPLRLNYLLWVDDLLSLCNNKVYDQKQPVIGFDLGTGAVAIYPLLGVKKLDWSFVCSESDDINFDSAKNNIKQNNLQHSVFIKKVENSSCFEEVFEDADVMHYISDVRMQHSNQNLELETNQDKSSEMDCRPTSCTPAPHLFDFSMCNPPFFTSSEELDSWQTARNRSTPSNAPTGCIQEKVVDGGEVGFIGKMIVQSLLYKDKVRIFTSLVGTKAHLQPIKKLICDAKPAHFVTTEFCQGRTMRWGIAWTFDPHLCLESIQSRKQKLSNKPLLFGIPRTQMQQYNVSAASNLITIWMKELKVKYKVFKSNKYFHGVILTAFNANWRNQRQMRRQKKKQQNNSDDMVKPDDTYADSGMTTLENISNSSVYDCTAEGVSHDSSPPCKRRKSNKCDLLSDAVNNPSSNTSMFNTQNIDNGDMEVGYTHTSTQKHNYTHESISDTPPGTTTQVSDMENLSESCQNTNSVITDITSGINPSNNTPKSISTPLVLKCSLHLTVKQGTLMIEMQYINGTAGKDGVHQLLQFIKNKFKSNMG